MSRKRTTIYDLADALKISASYVSRALNNDPFINEKTKKLVNAKALEMNYKQNANAFNLRKGITRTLGVIVPKIDEMFFAHAISGIEEACSEHNYNLIICQSQESVKKEAQAVEILIRQNVDCILISISIETASGIHLQQVLNSKIHLIQFDRVREEVESFKIENDNIEAAYTAVKHLVKQGYKKIAHLGGPGFLKNFSDRKQGYVNAMKDSRLNIPNHFIIEGTLSREAGFSSATALLTEANRPDAIFCSSDIVALGVIQAAAALKIIVPEELGVIGFQNEPFDEMLVPSLSSIDQNSKELGKHAANIYFNLLSKKKPVTGPMKEMIACTLKDRDSTRKNSLPVNLDSKALVE